MNYLYQNILILKFLLFSVSAYAQIENTNFEDIETKQNHEPKFHIVFLHTDWCKHCKTMEKTTLQNKEIAELINTKFYFSKLNGEEQRKITFYGKSYYFLPKGRNNGTHELATKIGTLNGILTYPTLILLNPKNEIIFQLQGFVTAKDLRNLLESVF
ncbi:MAG: thioredoxin family protein [Cruoricaptor ignavus]|nr:thioredoxin family protein [Cruoricaptor ignavus]